MVVVFAECRLNVGFWWVRENSRETPCSPSAGTTPNHHRPKDCIYPSTWRKDAIIGISAENFSNTLWSPVCSLYQPVLCNEYTENYNVVFNTKTFIIFFLRKCEQASTSPRGGINVRPKYNCPKAHLGKPTSLFGLGKGLLPREWATLNQQHQ